MSYSPVVCTRGRLLLIAVLQRSSGRFVAARCRVTPAAVSRWAGGSRSPTLEARSALALAYGLPVDAWDKPSSR